MGVWVARHPVHRCSCVQSAAVRATEDCHFTVLSMSATCVRVVGLSPSDWAVSSASGCIHICCGQPEAVGLPTIEPLAQPRLPPALRTVQQSQPLSPRHFALGSLIDLCPLWSRSDDASNPTATRFDGKRGEASERAWRAKGEERAARAGLDEERRSGIALRHANDARKKVRLVLCNLFRDCGGGYTRDFG